MELGHDMHAFIMRRGGRAEPARTAFPNTHFGWSSHEKLTEQAWLILRSVLCMMRHGKQLAQADVIVARNLDMLAIARASRVPLVYECLDIHKAKVGTGGKSRLMCAAERFLLRRISVLAPSSSACMTRFFQPVQGYDGPHVLWEKKLPRLPEMPARPVASLVCRQGPLRLGMVGSLRCRPLILLLTEVARRLGSGRIEATLHGYVQAHETSDFDALIAGVPNVHWHGAYAGLTKTPQVNAGCDGVWNTDLWLKGGQF